MGRGSCRMRRTGAVQVDANVHLQVGHDLVRLTLRQPRSVIILRKERDDPRVLGSGVLLEPVKAATQTAHSDRFPTGSRFSSLECSNAFLEFACGKDAYHRTRDRGHRSRPPRVKRPVVHLRERPVKPVVDTH